MQNTSTTPADGLSVNQEVEYCTHGRTDHGICIECGEIRDTASDDFGKRWIDGKLVYCPQPEDEETARAQPAKNEEGDL